MVYAMMSIGVLGFVVWSQRMAFPLSDLWVINSTVGWNGLLFLFIFLHNTKLENLLDTFYSLNSNRNAQSAGNSCLSIPKFKLEPGQRGSSETIRGNTYDLFKINFACFFHKNFKKDNNWLSWFVGFLEGDGAILEHKGRSYMVISQKDDTVLHEIYETLNIGKVKYFYDNNGNKKFSRYIVSDNNGIFLLYLLLNGNLVLQSRINQLNKWNIALKNAKIFKSFLFNTKEIPELIGITKVPSINDSWLSGFTDAEGCFSVKIGNEKKRFYVQIIYILDQKNEESALNKIGSLFSDNKAIVRKPNIKNPYVVKPHNHLNNKVNIQENSKMFRLSFYCNGKNKLISNKIINYFNTYNLKTSKKKSFRIWTEILNIVLNKQPLPAEDLKKVRKLRHNMNLYIIENKPMGYAKKS